MRGVWCSGHAGSTTPVTARSRAPWIISRPLPVICIAAAGGAPIPLPFAVSDLWSLSLQHLPLNERFTSIWQRDFTTLVHVFFLPFSVNHSHCFDKFFWFLIFFFWQFQCLFFPHVTLTSPPSHEVRLKSCRNLFPTRKKTSVYSWNWIMKLQWKFLWKVFDLKLLWGGKLFDYALLTHNAKSLFLCCLMKLAPTAPMSHKRVMCHWCSLTVPFR